jgi:hypothetical protein
VDNSGTDTDGDGFADEFEIALGSNPTDPNSTPNGIVAGTTAQDLKITKIGIKLNFVKNSSDSITLSGTIATSVKDFTNVQAAVDVGGVIQSFKLDKKGSGTSGAKKINKIKLSAPKKGAQATFQVSFSKGTFRTELTDEGLTAGTDVKNGSRTVTVDLLVGPAHYRTSKKLTYTAKKGKSGSAVAAK